MRHAWWPACWAALQGLVPVSVGVERQGDGCLIFGQCGSGVAAHGGLLALTLPRFRNLRLRALPPSWALRVDQFRGFLGIILEANIYPASPALLRIFPSSCDLRSSPGCASSTGSVHVLSSLWNLVTHMHMQALRWDPDAISVCPFTYSTSWKSEIMQHHRELRAGRAASCSVSVEAKKSIAFLKDSPHK